MGKTTEVIIKVGVAGKEMVKNTGKAVATGIGKTAGFVVRGGVAGKDMVKGQGN